MIYFSVMHITSIIINILKKKTRGKNKKTEKFRTSRHVTRFSPFLILKVEPGATVLLSASVCNDNAMLCIVTAHFGGTATVPREMKEVGMIIRDGGVSPRRTRFRLLHSELTIFSRSG